MDTLDLALRGAGLIFSGIAIVLAVVYHRRLLFDQARRELSRLQADTIAALQGRMRILEATVESGEHSLEQCERQRAAAHEALATWDRLIGNIWIDSAKTQADSGE